MIFQNETHNYFLCKSVENGQPVVQLYKSVSKDTANVVLLASQKLTSNKPVSLKIKARADTYAFYFATKKKKWKLLKPFMKKDITSGAGRPKSILHYFFNL